VKSIEEKYLFVVQEFGASGEHRDGPAEHVMRVRKPTAMQSLLIASIDSSEFSTFPDHA